MRWSALLACGLGLCPASLSFITPNLAIVKQSRRRVGVPGTCLSRQHDPNSSLLGTLVAAAAVAFAAFIAAGGGAHHPASTADACATATFQQSLPSCTSTMRMSRGEGAADHAAGAAGLSGFGRGVKVAFTSAAVALTLVGPMLSLPGSAGASDKRVVGEISASGLVFKDKLNVEAFSDPKVKGVTLYLSDFSRPVADKLMNGDIFSDPSSAALFCVRSGPMEVKEGINTSKDGEELFKEDRSFFKSIVVRRLYDKEADNVVYVSYSSKLDTGSDGNKSRFKSSLCALHVE